MSLPAPSADSTALITGASSGIGEQFARQLAARGHHVTLVARRRDLLEALAGELGDVAVLPADLADAEARDKLAASVSEAGRSVSILVNNAGFGIYEPFVDSDHAKELTQVRLLVDAVVDLTHRLLPEMVERGRGAIINLSSTSGFQPGPYNAGYAAAKAYVLSLSESLHGELAGTGVTATAVCPGPVATEFQDASEAHFAEKLPRIAWVSAERVVADALAAADRGKRVIVPGGPVVKATFHPNRFIPTAMTNPLLKRLMRP